MCFVAFFFAQPVGAQIQKGDWLGNGHLTFSYYKPSNTSIDNLNLDVLLSANYSLTSHFILGLGLNFRRNSFFNTSHLYLAPSFTYYKSLNDRWIWFLGAKYSSPFITARDSNDDQNYTSFTGVRDITYLSSTAGIYTSFIYQLSKRCFFGLSYDVLGITLTQRDELNYSNGTITSQVSAFDVETYLFLKPSAFYFSFYYRFNKPKEQKAE